MTVAIVLLVLAFLLVFAEIFLPGGILGTIALILTGISCYLIYEIHGMPAAVAVFVIFIVVAVALLILGFTFLRKLPGFGGLILGQSQKGETGISRQTEDGSVVGRTGEALTTMAPTGSVVIDGRKYEASSQSGMVEKGMEVRVVSQDSFRLIVRRLD